MSSHDSTGAGSPELLPKPVSAGTLAAQKKDLSMSIVTQPVINDVSNPVSARSIPQTPYTASPDYLHIRCLVTMKEAGVIIGKQGKNIADIRERSTAKVMVSELQQGAHERIITISGSLEVVARAFSMLAKKVLDEFQMNAVDTQLRGIPETQHNVRLLIPHNRMGGIIGKGGAKIKEIQEVSGARLNASEEMLPNSTERIITVRGVPDMIHIAVYHIGLILIEGNEKYPDRSTIQYKPLAKYYQHVSPGIYSPTTSAMHAPPLPAPGSRPARYSQPQSPVMPQTPRGTNVFDQQIPAPLPTGHEQQQIFIPNDMVGCIIGKGGNRIKEIRQQSQCQVRVAEAGNAQGERLITISGTPEGCQMALYMLYNRLEDEKKRALERPNGLAQ